MKREFRNVFGLLFSTFIFLAVICTSAFGQNKQTTCGQKKADKLLEQGRAEYNKKNYPQALSFFDQAVKASPKCPVPFFDKGLVFMDSKKYDEAVNAFQEAMQRNFNEVFRLHFGICQSRFSQNNYQEAVKSCEESARLNNSYYWTFHNLAYLYGNLNDFDKSMSATQRALELDSKSVEMLIYKSRLLYDFKKYDEAVAALTETIKIKPDSEEALILLTVSYAQLRNLDKSLEMIQRAYDLNPKSFQILTTKAGLLNDLKRYNEALPLALELVKLKPDNEGALFVLGISYFNLRNYGGAIENLTRAVKINPDYFEAWLFLSSAYTQYSRNWEKAENAAVQAVRLRPDYGDAYYQLGLCQLINGKPELSIKSFDTAIKNKNIQIVSSAVYKGFAYIALKKYAEAEESFQQALTLTPGDKSDYFSLGIIYNYRWELDKVREMYKKGIDYYPDDDDGDAYSGLSWTYILDGNPQQAIIAANEAVQQNPKHYNSYTNRCRAYNEINLPDIAIKDCQKSLELKPNNGEPLFYLGRSYALKKDTVLEKSYNQKAIVALEKRLGIAPIVQTNFNGSSISNSPTTEDEGVVSINSPGYSYYLYLLASAYSLDNNFPAAIRAYEKVTELQPRFPRLRFNLAVSYLRLKSPDLKSAETQYQILLKLDAKMAADLKKIINGYKRKK